MTVQLKDLDLTDAIWASLIKNYPGIEHYGEFARWAYRKNLLEAVLPVLPHVIKQVGTIAFKEGYLQSRADSREGQDYNNPYHNYETDISSPF